MRKLTDLEQEEVLRHYVSDDGRAGGGLVGWFIAKHRLDYDEWHGDVCLSLMKAVETYDSNKGALSTYFYTIANNMRRSAKRKTVNSDGEKITPVLRHEYDIEEIVQFSLRDDYSSMNVEYLISELTDRQKRVVRLLIEGYNQTEIAGIIGLTPRTIRTEVSKIRESVRGMMRHD